jgi:hypothetical protein
MIVCFFLNSKNGAFVQKGKRNFFNDEEITSSWMNFIYDMSGYDNNEFVNLLAEKKLKFLNGNGISSEIIEDNL